MWFRNPIFSGSDMKPIIIAGPTASGKSALALAIAERDDGCIINADALQVYACWRILTARPGESDLARAPHYLFGHIDCATRYSVGNWIREVAVIVGEARHLGQRAIFVGGTGLYLSTLTSGLSEIPPIAPEIRRRCDALVATDGVAALLADLSRDDPQTLRNLDQRNPMRVRRAWEVQAATGTGLAEWRRRVVSPVLKPQEFVGIVASMETKRLEERIRNRVWDMIDSGALEECARFRARRLDRAAPAGRVLGAAQLVAHLDGELTLQEAVTSTITATRQYAKRQRSWFRNRMPDWQRLDLTEDGALERFSLD